MNTAVGVIQLDNNSAHVRNGFAAERSAGGSINLSQLIYSESARAGVDIAQAQQDADLAAQRKTVVRLPGNYALLFRVRQ